MKRIKRCFNIGLSLNRVQSMFLPVVLLIYSCINISCGNNSKNREPDQSVYKNQLTEMNRTMVENESKVIDEFVTRHYFKVKMTGTGLRYQIYYSGKGAHPALHDSVLISYKVFLLDGTLCYSTDSSGPRKFHIGEGELINGLEEGLMLMVPGDKARLIIPSHLAYGNTGDLDKIPPASALFYDIELVKVNP